jgi:hypothetical protein
MKKGVVLTVAPLSQVQWSHPMDPTKWDQTVGVVKATTCLNRFELLASGEDVDSETMRKWAHERLDEWLDKR